MEKISGIPGSIPSLVNYPADSIRNHIPLQEWQSCLDTWLFSIEFRLRLANEHFTSFKFSQPASGIPFLLSYLSQYEQRPDPIQSGSEEAKLHHHCYLLLRRLLLTTRAPHDCSAAILFDLLTYGCLSFHTIPDWRVTLRQYWKRNNVQIRSSIESCKSSIVKSAPSDTAPLLRRLQSLSALVKCLPDSAVVAVAGADYLEAMISAYSDYASETQKMATECLYHCLRSFMTEENKHTSLLLDTLFEVKSGTDLLQKTSESEATLLSSLVCSTPFLRHLRSDPAVVAGNRGQGLVETLSTYRHNMAHLHSPARRSSKRQVRGKGKGKADPAEEMHMHKASKISQVHDLFPDLSSGYVLKLLDHYSDDVETVIAALLEPDSLPRDLQDQSAEIDAEIEFPSIDQPSNLAPRSTPPLVPQRKNVFDGDEFDLLHISSAKLHKGRKEIVDQPQSHNEHSRSKAAIMAALAAFDADDDERDDSYDVADVGGAVDNTVDTDERRGPIDKDQVEETLFRAWKANPELFGRDSKTRVSTPRRQLGEDTGMANEQIEGWAIMMNKDPKMGDRLQQKYSIDRTFRGNQSVIQSTRWQADSPSDSQDEGNMSQSDGRRVGQAGIRGPRVWNRGTSRGGGRGGGATGSSSSEATQLARKRKEQGRGRGGAHNRRDGRAKKIGRGMGGPAE